MKTNVIMKRDFNGAQISQRSCDKFFNGTELLQLYNQTNQTQRRFKDFWENQNTQAFLIELENDILNGGNCPHLKTHETSRGKGGATWLHPFLFVKFSMWLSPKFELQIIKWVYDNLIDFRTQAGDYYREMCQSLKEYCERNNIAQDALIYKREASVLNTLVFGTTATKQRDLATEYELALMNDLQLYNITLLEDNKSDRKSLIFERAKAFKKIHERKLLQKP